MMINGSNLNLPISRAYAGGPLELPDSSSDRQFQADPVDTFELSANSSDDGLWKPVVPLFRGLEMAAVGNDGMWRPVDPVVQEKLKRARPGEGGRTGYGFLQDSNSPDSVPVGSQSTGPLLPGIDVDRLSHNAAEPRFGKMTPEIMAKLNRDRPKEPLDKSRTGY